jgi:hypothetical protein
MKTLRRATRVELRKLRSSLLRVECLEERCLLSGSPPFWPTMAQNPQHTGDSTVASQPLQTIRWQTPVDLNPQFSGNELLIHYGEPLFSAANTVIVPVKFGATDGFQIEAHNGATGALLWSQTSDYILPSSGWTPSYSPALTPNNRVYFAGAGGTIYYRSDVDLALGATHQLAFYGLVNYQANQAAFNATVFIDTPITSDGSGNIYFGVRVTGSNPLGLQSGIARIDAQGNATFVTARAAAGNDSRIGEVPINCAPALSNDGKTLYIAVRSAITESFADLVGIDSTTLAPKFKVHLLDPRDGGSNDAAVFDISSATPTVGPDGDVYYGIFGNPFNGSRGWMLHFSADLRVEKTPGAFGWDTTPSIVPASMVPSYTGSSKYLLFTKYNNYAGIGFGDWADGVNKIAILDPNATEVDPHASSHGLLVMKEVLTVTGPTPDTDFRSLGFPNAVREWCINSCAVDPLTHSVLANSEDGKLYRWDLHTNKLSEVITLTPGLGEAYTPTAIGPDGTVYAINNATLFAVGLPVVSIGDVGMFEQDGATTAYMFNVTLSNPSPNLVTVHFSTADGTASVADGDYQPVSGTITFGPGQTTQTIFVLVGGDAQAEPDESFFVNLRAPVNGVLGNAQGVGVILGDDKFPLSKTSWTPIGPASANAGELWSGRIAGVAADPTNANVIYVGAAGGGVWKTTNGGLSWVPLTDNQATLFMGAIAVAPSNPNVIYAGTGEANMGPSKSALGRNNIYYGEGVLKSDDGGATWTLEGNAFFHRRTISRIVVDPVDPNTVYVAVGALATNGLPGNTGIWKSTDGGVTWTDTTAGISSTAAFSDLAMNPINDQVLYAAVGQPTGDTANGLYITTDGGTSWARAGNFPSGADDGNLGRVMVAVSASDPQTLYASIAHKGVNASLYKMLKSTDGGATWSELTEVPNYLGPYGDYDTSLAVDPHNPNLVYAGGTVNNAPDFIQSMDGGITWNDIEFGFNGVSLHGDEHGIAFDALGRLLAVDDGGIFRLDSPDPFFTSWTDLNSNLNTIQFTGISLDPTNPAIVYGGNQDNGTVAVNGDLVWNVVEGGDGGYTLVNPMNPQRVYHDAAVGSFGPADFVRRSDDGGLTWTSITAGIHADVEPSVFYPPMIMDPSNPDRLFLGTSRVYETTTGGDLWNPISTPGLNGWTSRAAIDAIAVSPSDPNTIYATAGGHIFVTFDDGGSWRGIDVPGAADHIQGLTVDPRNHLVAYAVRDRFGGGHVFLTTDGGRHWINISGNLPDTPANAVALDPRTNNLYVGTDLGVYVSTNGDGNWTPPASGMPNAKVVQFDLQLGLNILGVATHGRGAWELDITPMVTHFSVTGPSNTVAGAPFMVSVTALDAHNHVVSSFRGTVHLSSSDTRAGLPADYSFTAGDDGSHVFTLTLFTAGTQSIHVINTGSSAVTGSTTLSVIRAPLILSVTGFPAPDTAGTTAGFVVTAQDPFGNIDTNYRGTVAFFSNDPQAVLPAHYTFMAADHGVHTFAATLKTAGTRFVAAMDTVNATIKGSEAITVVAAALSEFLVFGFTSPTTAGVAHNFKVEAADAFGNRVIGYRGTVHFTSSDPQASLPSNYTFTAADHGIHTFTAKLDSAGLQSITATDRVTSSVTGSQSNIRVVPAAAVKLVVSGFPTKIAAGTAGPLQVTAVDPFGNVAKAYRGTIHFTSSDPAAVLPADASFTSGNAGTRSFTVTLKTAGTRSITATDTVTASITGTESGIIVADLPVPQDEEETIEMADPVPMLHEGITDLVMASHLWGPAAGAEELLTGADDATLGSALQGLVNASALAAVTSLQVPSPDQRRNRRG